MDIATLGLRIDGSGSIQQVKQFGDASEKAGRQTDQLEASVKRQDAALRQLAESWSTQNSWMRTSHENYLRQTGQMERFLQIQRQIDREMQVADRVAAQHAATQATLGRNVDLSALGFNRLRGGVQSLLTVITGFNPVVAQTAGVLGSFAVGAATTVGILAGIAAISIAYNKLTEGSRKLKEQTDQTLDALLKQKQAAFDASVTGRGLTVDLAKKALAEAQANQAAVSGRNVSFATGLNPIAGAMASLTGGGAVTDAKALQDATEKVTQAERNLRDAKDEETRARMEGLNRSYELEKSLAADRKRWSDEEKQAWAEREAQLARVLRLLNAANTGNFGAGASFSIEQGLALRPIAPLTGVDRAAAGAYNSAYINLPGGHTVAVPQGLGGPTAQTYQQRQQVEQNLNLLLGTGLVVPVRTAGTEITKMARATGVAAQAINNAVTTITSRVGGPGVLSGLGGGIGQAAAGLLGGFGGGAIGQAIFGPIAAGIGAAIGKVFDNIAATFFGQSSEERAKIRATRLALADMTATMEILRQKSLGANTALLEALEANRKYYQGIKDQIDAALPGTKNEAERNAKRAEADAYAAKDAERIKADYERAQRERGEDLEVRALQAQGKSKEAEALRRQLEAQREYDAAVKSGESPAYLARLKEIQALEANAAATRELTNSLRNSPSGFKIEPYTYQYGIARPNPFNSPLLPTPFRPQGGPTSTGNSFAGATFNFALPNVTRPEEVGPAFTKWLDEFGARTLGINALRSDVLEIAPTHG